MKKILMLMFASFVFASPALAAKTNANNKVELYYKSLEKCNKELDDDIKKICPKVGYVDDGCSYTYYTDLKISLNNKQLACYNDVANKLFEDFYTNDIKKQKEIYKTFVDACSNSFDALYTDTNLCNQQNCGTSIHLQASDSINFFIYQYIKENIEYIQNKIK